MRQKNPSKLELAILSLLWNSEGMTAREVLDGLPDGKQRAYTSVLSVLQAMERKKLVNHTTKGNANVYHPLVKQESTVGRTLRDLVRDVFGGSPAVAVQHLLNESDLTESELKEVERLVSGLRKQRGKKQGEK